MDALKQLENLLKEKDAKIAELEEALKNGGQIVHNHYYYCSHQQPHQWAYQSPWTTTTITNG